MPARVRPGEPPEEFDGARALQCEESRVVRNVLDRGIRRAVTLDPGQVALPVRCVHHEHELAAAEPVDQQVVQIAAALVEQGAVVRATHLELCDVVRCQSLEERFGTLAGDTELPHVRHVEQAGRGTHRPMLVHHAGVLDGHLPAGERHHPRAVSEVPFVECRAAQEVVVGWGRRHGADPIRRPHRRW